MDHLKIRGTIGFDVLNLIGLVGLRLRSQKGFESINVDILNS